MTVTALRKVTGRWSCPDARLVLRADAPREMWLGARTQGIGGSDASTCAEVNRFSNRHDLFLEKTGRWVDNRDNDAMEWGRRLEPVIRQWFAENTGLEVRRAGLMASRRHPWQIVSVDGLVGDGGGLEIKTTNWRMAEEWDDDQIPDHAEIQAQHAMAVTGRPHWWIAGLLDGRTPLLRRVERDDALIASLTEIERRFWFDHVLADVPPAVTGSSLPGIKQYLALVGRTYTEAPAGEVEPLLARLAEAKAAVKAAQADADTAEAQLRLLAGDAEEVHVDGATRITCKANGSFSPKRFAEDHPDVAAQFTTTVEALDVHRLKTEKPDLYGAYRARVLRPVAAKKNGGK